MRYTASAPSDGIGAMADDHHGGAGPGPRPQRLQDDAAVGVVQISGRLVGQQQRRIVQHRAAERHALLLAAGELRRIVVLRARARRTRASSSRARRRRLAGRRGPRSGRPAARCRARSARAAAGTTGRRSRRAGRAPGSGPTRPSALTRSPAHTHVAAVGVLQQPEHVQQRALAGARGPRAPPPAVRPAPTRSTPIEHADRRAGRAPGTSSRAARASSTAADRLGRRQPHDPQRRVRRPPPRRAAPRTPSAPPSSRPENRKSCWPVRAAQPSTAAPRSSASPTPSAPPVSVTASASPSTSRPSCRSVAPSARLTPKSRMRSKTAAATVLASDSPPMTKASTPMPTSSAEKNAVDERSRPAQLARDLHVDAGHALGDTAGDGVGILAVAPADGGAGVEIARAAARPPPEASTVRSSGSLATHCCARVLDRAR